MGIGVFALFLLTVFRYYGDVEYRLNLNYQRYFIYYLLIGVGYLAGFVIYRITDQWLFVMWQLQDLYFISFFSGVTIFPWRWSADFS